MARLLIVTRDYLPMHNGLSDHTALVVSCLRVKFDSIEVICETSRSRAPDQAQQDGVHVSEFRAISGVFSTVNSVISERRPDVVLFEYVPHMWGRAGIAPIAAFLPMWIRFKFGIPVVSFLHELYYSWDLAPKRLFLGLIHRAQLMVIGFTSKALIVTNSQRYARLSRIWRYKLARIPAGNVSARKSDYRRVQVYPWPYIAWFGTLGPDQDIEGLVSAFLCIAKEDKDLRLVMVGGFETTSPRIQDVRAMTEKAGLSERIIFRGYVDDDELSDILTGSIANIVMYSTGPSGRRGVVAASLRSGRTMIAVQGSETDPEFHHNRNVLLVPRGDVTSLVTAIRNMCSSPELRKFVEMGSRQLFETYYSDRVIAKNLAAVIDRAVRNDIVK